MLSSSFFITQLETLEVGWEKDSYFINSRVCILVSKNCLTLVNTFLDNLQVVNKYLKLIGLSSDEPRNAKKEKDRHDLMQVYRSDFCV